MLRTRATFSWPTLCVCIYVYICDLFRIRFIIFSPFVIISTTDPNSSDFTIEILRLFRLVHAYYKAVQANLIAPIIP